MKKISTLLLLGALFAASALSAATFEGKVTMKMTGQKGTPQVMTLSLKEGFYRMDMAVDKNNSMGMIMDLTKQEMLILMVSQKMYLIRPIPKPEEHAGQEGGDHGDVTLDKTGETEVILGYTCVKYLVKSKDSTSELWVTDQLGTFMGLGSGGNPMGGRSAPKQAWEKALVGKNFFPLRTVVLGKDGKEAFRMEVTAIDKQSLSADTFEPPADFQKLDMAGMMKGMMPGR